MNDANPTFCRQLVSDYLAAGHYEKFQSSPSLTQQESQQPSSFPGIDTIQPTYQTLCQLIQYHQTNFSFCTVMSRLYGGDDDNDCSHHKKRQQQQIPQLDFESLYNDIVKQQRGGYCIQHNKLFYHVLQHLGFLNVRLVLARIMNNRTYTPQSRPPLTHLILVLELPNHDSTTKKYVVDVAYGGDKCPTIPIPLDGEEVYDDTMFSEEDNAMVFRIHHHQQQDHQEALINAMDDPYHMQVSVPTTQHNNTLKEEFCKEWFTTYQFELTSSCCSETDCEMSHFYSYKSRNAIFVKNLYVSILRRHTGCLRYGTNNNNDECDSNNKENKQNNRVLVIQLINNDFRIIALNQPTSNSIGKILTERTIQSPAELKEVLQLEFHIPINDEKSKELFLKNSKR